MEGIKDSLSLFGDIESFIFLYFMLFAKKIFCNYWFFLLNSLYLRCVTKKMRTSFFIVGCAFAIISFAVGGNQKNKFL